jgi:hypothetical protein
MDFGSAKDEKVKQFIGSRTVGNVVQKRAGIPRMWLWKFSLATLFFLLAAIFILAVVPAISPAFGADMADLLRTVFGPQPVAMLESTSAGLHDALSRYLYKNGSPQIAWTASTPLAEPASKPKRPASGSKVQGQLAPSNSPTKDNSAVALAAPQLGWQPYGPLVNGTAVLARTLISPDPNRPYAGVALVRMDLSRLQLHMMPGNQEPSHDPSILSAFPSLGMIPPSDKGKLVAAFNGGFKTINGHYGMMVNGVTLVPARPNMGTVAVYADGHVQIGTWGKDSVPSTNIVAYRQNCPALIDAGQLNPDLSYNNRNEWGYTGNTDITWRTGLGITQDGRYLIYAVGNGNSAMTLAQALQWAGAYSAVQLDINQYYAHFETYQPSTSSLAQGTGLVAQRLLDKMVNETELYLTPNARDFFYLTAR